MIAAQLMRPPARKLPAPFEAALCAALTAIQVAARGDDPTEAAAAFLEPLQDMRRRFETAGYPVQAAHVAAACHALSTPRAVKPGDFDDEALERERWAVLDQAQGHLQDALTADAWRPVMDVEASVVDGDRMELA
ncbi:hypothetical protein [Brevundimonas sp. UBA7664]|uniref:hypothetical protein n=1 Tax=Brevundimonas sp. UBA7664 TaxID=1946141 RepID=UPI0025BDF040|nr:hypothetical protein [Brevundimonas sp. UBA7664]